MKDTPLALEVSNIHKKFGQTEVLKGISLSAKKGDVISIIGSSGSGKSTFLRCMNLLEKPNEGNIKLHGEELLLKKNKVGELEPVSQKQILRFRAQMGFVFQNFNLWSHKTILQNVMEAPLVVLKKDKKTATEQAKYLLHKVGLHEKLDSYPIELSGGQQQRAAIARALAMEPEVLLFDEPTSALDPELVGEVLQVMQNLANEGKTMVIVTHEMRFARDVSSKILYLHQGVEEEFDVPEVIFKNPKSDRLRQFISQFI